MRSQLNQQKLYFILLMAVFGCMGPFVRAVGLPSPVTACLRAWISGLTIILFIVFVKKEIDKEEFKAALKPMIASGILLAFDWIGLFEAYNHTTIATATVCYYICPILVFIASPVILNEKYTLKHLICAIVAFMGMVLVSGVFDSGFSYEDIKGPLLALIGAAAYGAIILINKKFPSGNSILRTAIQLSVAAIVTTPYIFLTTDLSQLVFTGKTVLYLLIIGIVFTAVAYIIYFSLMVKLPAKTVAIFSYADPVVAVLISVIFLNEHISIFGIIGTVMILGAALVSEFHS